MNRVLITGASGFVAKKLYLELKKLNLTVRVTSTNTDKVLKNNIEDLILVKKVDAETNWKKALMGIDCIFHCAGISNNLNKKNYENIYHNVNVLGTKNLANQAAQAGVKRLIFLSSIKVNGENTETHQVEEKFNNKSPTKPNGAYAISKLEAEKELLKIASNTDLEVVIIRSPLIYGPGVKGNLKSLIKLINTGIPLPLKNIKNKRSLIGIDNLVNLLIHCIEHPRAKNQIFLASDGEDFSTPELLRIIGLSMKRSVKLFPFPVSLLKFFSLCLGKKEEFNKLSQSLQIDNKYLCETLNWKPPVGFEEGIKRMVNSK